MNESQPLFHPRRHQARPCLSESLAPTPRPDPVDQTTARLAALSEMVRELRIEFEFYQKHPLMFRSAKETDTVFIRDCSASMLIGATAVQNARNEVYAEIRRLCGPDDMIAKPEMVAAFEGVERRQAENARSEEEIGGAHAGL